MKRKYSRGGRLVNRELYDSLDRNQRIALYFSDYRKVKAVFKKHLDGGYLELSPAKKPTKPHSTLVFFLNHEDITSIAQYLPAQLSQSSRVRSKE